MKTIIEVIALLLFAMIGWRLAYKAITGSWDDGLPTLREAIPEDCIDAGSVSGVD